MVPKLPKGKSNLWGGCILNPSLKLPETNAIFKDAPFGCSERDIANHFFISLI
jgi:hypothetical protein